MRLRSKSYGESEDDTVAETTLDELADMDDSTIEKLLAQAKTNLEQNQSASRDQAMDEDDADLKRIRESYRRLPKLGDGLDLPIPVALPAKSGGPVHISDGGSSSTRDDLRFRKIEDPVAVKREAKAKREATAGSKWFDMPKGEMTSEMKRDLQLLKMRSVLDPKRHYKKDNSPLPTYFQSGTIIEGNTEYYSARLSTKERKKTIADEILADSESRKYFKRKYHDVQMSSTSGRRAYYKKLKQMRKKM